jgi:hypothetical protein
MADCELISACPFFNDRMKNMPAMSNIYKRNYCQGDHTNCARYMVREKLGKEKVPGDLYPNQQDRANMLIAEG